MSTSRKFRLLPGSGGRRKAEAERLDQFLTDLSDPGLINSLRQEEQRRKRLLLATAALAAGLLLGGGGVWLALRSAAALPAGGAEAHPAQSVATARILVSQGRSLAWAKQLPEAWSYLNLATELAPNLVEAWDALGMAQFFGGQMQAAERSFRRCLKIEPGYERGFHFLGDLNFYSRRFDRAEEFYRQAHANRALARVRLLQGRFPEAAPLVRQLTRERPDDRWVQVMAEAVRAGRLTPETRRRLDPGYVASWNAGTALGWRLFYAKDYNEASAVFGRVLAEHPDDDSAMLGKGWCLLKIGSNLEARPYFERVLAKWPASYSAMNGLGWCLRAEGQMEGALRSWQRLWELRPDSLETPEALKGIGTIHHERGDFHQAVLYLSKSNLLCPYDPETRKLLDDTLRKLSAGDSKELKF
ncbi:MAG TPA: tetratricopeptide repeat protein [Thermoanaerobaculia bacterium]